MPLCVVVRQMRVLLIGLVFLADCAAAQPPATASFDVYQDNQVVGTVEMTREATEQGWRLHGRGRTGGSLPATIPNLDLYYDRDWNGRFMTMEMKAPDDAIVHVAVTAATTRTDIVRSTQARTLSHSVSPDTIFLPDRALGAYEALAARLEGTMAGDDLPLFIPPLGETRTRVDAVAAAELRTESGSIDVTRYSLTEIRERPTPVEVWTDRGRLVRLDLPRAGIVMVREDVKVD